MAQANLLDIEIVAGEIALLNDLIETSKDEATKEELIQERMELVAMVNNRLGTGHIAKGSFITTINND